MVPQVHHVVNVKFNLSPILQCWPTWTLYIFHYIHSFSLFIMSLRTHLDRYCQQRAMANDRISPTRRSRSPTRAPPLATGSSPFQRPPGWTPPSTTPHRPVILQLDLKPMQQLAARNPYYNILTPKVAGNLSTETYDSLKVIYPDYARSHFVSDLKTVVTDTLLQRWSIHLQATDFYMMIDTDQGAQMLDDLPHSLLDILNWFYPSWKTHQHLDAFTSRECTPLLLTPHPDPQDTGFAVHIQVIPRGHPFVTATRYTKTAAWHPWHAHTYKRKKDRLWKYWAILLIIFITNFFLLIPCFLEGSRNYFHLRMLFIPHAGPQLTNFGLSLSWPYIYCFYTWRPTRLMASLGWSQHFLRWPQPMALIHISNLMTQLRHRIFPGWPEWLQLLQPFTLYSSRSSVTRWLLDLMNFGSWNGQQQRNLETSGNISGKHAPHEGPCYIANHCQPLAPVLRDTYPIILLLYNNILPGSTTSRTYQRPRLTAIRGHPWPTLHSPIVLGTLCSTSLTRYHYFFILATMEIYTTVFTIDNTSPDPTLQQPYYTCSSSSSPITCGWTRPYGYVRLQRVT